MAKVGGGETIRAACPAIARERAQLLSLVDVLRDEDLDYRPPTPGDPPDPPLSIREILLHVLDVDHRMLEAATGRVAFIAPPLLCDESISRVVGLDRSAYDLREIRRQLEEDWKRIEAVLDRPANTLHRAVASGGGAPSLLAVLEYALMHQAEHRGQLRAYMILIGRVDARA